AGCVQKLRIMVDEPPALPRRQIERLPAQIGAGAAGEVDDPDMVPPGERPFKERKQPAIARGVVGGFAQREPIGRKTTHPRPFAASMATRATISAVSSHPGKACPARHDAS